MNLGHPEFCESYVSLPLIYQVGLQSEHAWLQVLPAKMLRETSLHQSNAIRLTRWHDSLRQLHVALQRHNKLHHMQPKRQ